jgi:hypothetical protein
MWHVLYRTIDGRLHRDRAFSSREEAIEYLWREAEECLPTHRRVIFNPEEGILVTAYGGDDDVASFVVSDNEMHLYEEYLQ